MQPVVTAPAVVLRDVAISEPAASQTWVPWPVHWGAAWLGALGAVAAIVLLGLIGVAVGAPLVGAENRVVDLKKIAMGALAYSVFTSFLAFVLGGWIAGKVAGIIHSEPAILHGAVTWLLTVPILIVLGALGAGSYVGGWFAGLSGSPSWSAPAGAPYERPDANGPIDSARATTEWEEYRAKVKLWRDETPKAVRNAALGAVTALLLGLMGSVVGGWMASGEPMNPWYDRTRVPAA